MSALGNLVVSLALDHTKFETGLKKSEYAAQKSTAAIAGGNRTAGKTFDDLYSRADKFASKIEFMAHAGVALTAAWQGLRYIGGVFDEFDQIGALAQRFGTSAESLQALGDAAEQSDTDLATLAGGLNKLTTRMYEAAHGDKALAGEFKSLGIDAVKFAASSDGAEQAIFALADRIAAARSPAEALTIATRALGKSAGPELIPLLSQGGAALRAMSDEARQSGRVLSGETLQQVKQFNDDLAALNRTFKVGLVGMSGPFITELNKMMNAIKEEKSTWAKFLLTVGSPGVAIANAFGAGIPITSIEKAKYHSEKLFQELADAQAKLEGLKNKKDTGGLGGLLIRDDDIARNERYVASIKARLREETLAYGQLTKAEADAAKEKAKAAADARKNAAKAFNVNGGNAGKETKNPLTVASMADALSAYQLYDLPAFEAELAQDQAAEQSLSDHLQWMQEERAHQLATLAEIGDPRAAWNNLENRLSRARAGIDSVGGIISSAEASNQSQVVAGIKSQAQAQMDLRAAIGQQGDTLADMLPDLKAMMMLYGPEQRAEIQAMIDKIREWQAIGQQKGWQSGMAAGLHEYSLAAVDTFATVKDATLKAMQGMEDGILNFTKTGKLSFRDMANSIIDDMLRMSIRAGITAPLSSMLGSFIGSVGQPANIAAFSSANFADISAFSTGFADGGVMSDRGPLPLNRYAAGGIANTPQLALFGEGRMNEAFVPLPDGRSIPVTMQGGGGVSVTQHITIDARGSDAGIEQKIFSAMKQATAAAVAEINTSLMRGGRTAKLAGVA